MLLGSLFLLPFTALPYFSDILREVSTEGAFYLLLPTILLTFFFLPLNVKKVFVDRAIIKVCSIYLLYIFIIFLINYGVISSSVHMDKAGVSRFIFQYIELGFGFIIIFTMSYIINTERKLYLVYKKIYLFTLIVIFFTVFQFLAYYFKDIFLSVYEVITSPIYSDNVVQGAKGRLHGFGSEPSHLAFYFAVVLPYVLMKLIDKRGYVIIALIFLIVFLSFSRTLYGVFLIESFLLIYLINYKYMSSIKLTNFMIIFLVISALLGGIELLSAFDPDSGGSSYTRMMVIYAALQAWLDNNIWIGLGLGQTGFFLYNYISEFGIYTHELSAVYEHRRWPFIHNLHIRILVETGIVGFTIWLYIWYIFARKVHVIIKNKYIKCGIQDNFGYAALTSLIGVFVALLSRENLTNMNIWIALGLAYSYIVINKKHL
jgi:hypothetical protein